MRFTHVAGPFATEEEAFAVAARLTGAALNRPPAPLEVIGDFVVPPAGGPPSRDFQTLHLDFGLPLVPRRPGDLARFTALHVPADAAPSSATTRLVALDALLAQRAWPDRDELLRRLAAYGETHGAWDDAAGYVEGSLARIVEAAAGGPPVLPSVKADPAFLCGNEFAGLGAEEAFFAAHGLSVGAVAVEVALAPGELLVFDNLAVAHGRRGVRPAGELRQRVFGHRALDVGAQRALRDGVLSSFAAGGA